MSVKVKKHFLAEKFHFVSFISRILFNDPYTVSENKTSPIFLTKYSTISIECF